MAKEPRAGRNPYADIAPALAEYSEKVLFGDVWKRPGLSCFEATRVRLPPPPPSVLILTLTKTNKYGRMTNYAGLTLLAIWRSDADPRAPGS